VVCGLLGSVAGGFIADRIGHRRTVALATVATGLMWIGFAATEPMWVHRRFIVIMTCGEQLFLGVLSAALFALFMGVAWRRVAAMQFSAYMAMLNLSRTFGSKMAGSVSDTFGFVGSFAVMGGLQIAAALWLLALDPQQSCRELGEDRS
jgi:PAT family beta-lactamase induction signal transducer AmpG